MELNEEEIRDLVLRELPDLLRRDRSFRESILRLAEDRFAPKAETEGRFEHLLEELRRDREDGQRRWEESSRHWEENSRRWEENSRRWEENSRRWEESSRHWEENSRHWEENSRRWEENQKAINGILEELRLTRRRHESSIGALGARWGLRAEASFREALKGILEESFGVTVLNITEFDDEGEVFGRPDQIELDIVVKNGTLIVCEIKSSVSKGDVFLFDRKVRFYEKRHARKASRRILISPMIDAKASALAKTLGLESFTSAEAMVDDGPGL